MSEISISVKTVEVTPELMNNPFACDQYTRTVRLERQSAILLGKDSFASYKDSEGYYIKVRKNGKYVKVRLLSCKVTDCGGVCIYNFNAATLN